MCNIAGYVGTRPAAPILLEMMKKEEGFAGGYNTGIATIHQGKLYHTKLVGSTQKLIDETDALTFPGNIGICHSRSKSHSGSEWAHPFVGIQEGVPVCAYIANGNPGKKSDKTQEGLTADVISEMGYEMLSKVYNPASKANYPTLSDGSKVHSSDLMCQLIFKYKKEGYSSPEAMENAFFDLIAERVGLFISLDHPDKIAWARGNMPVFVAFADHGAYIASTPLAFPNDAGEPKLLMANSAGWLTCENLTQQPFKKVNLEVPPLDAYRISKGYDIVLNELQSGGKTFNELLKATAELFENCECSVRAALIYTILYSMKNRDMINIDTFLDEPIFEGIEVPKFRVSLK